MSYTNWDNTALDTFNRVTAYCRHIAGTAGFTDGTTRPGSTEVEYLLTDSYWEIAGLLERYGYSTAQTNANVKSFLVGLHAVTAAIKVEQASPSSGTGEPNERFKAFQDTRARLEELIKSNALAQMGASKDRARSAYTIATGISESRKTSVEDDSDVVQPRFKRGWGQSTLTGGESTNVDLES